MSQVITFSTLPRLIQSYYHSGCREVNLCHSVKLHQALILFLTLARRAAEFNREAGGGIPDIRVHQSQWRTGIESRPKTLSQSLHTELGGSQPPPPLSFQDTCLSPQLRDRRSLRIDSTVKLTGTKPCLCLTFKCEPQSRSPEAQGKPLM